MNSDQPAQEFTNLRWGTLMPIALRIGSEFVQVRARGSYSVTIQDTQRLQNQVPNPEDLQSYVKSLIVNTLTEVIGELSMTISNASQLTTIEEPAVQELCARLDPKFNEVGLQLKAVTIEAIEKV